MDIEITSEEAKPAEETGFAIGDVVTLRSGGPKMTITEVGQESITPLTVTVTWFQKCYMGSLSANEETYSQLYQGIVFPANAVVKLTS
jgi:uncharacterized protein YodC (DUF2158 family)